MRSAALILSIAFLFVALGCGSPEPLEPDMSGKNTPIVDKPVAEKPIESHGMLVWPVSKKLEVEAEICNSGSLVEFFAVAPYGHKYESILSVNCRPSQFHTALILLGGVDRASARTQGKKIMGSRFNCMAKWMVPDRFVRVTPDKGNENLKPKMLYAMLIEDNKDNDTSFTVNNEDDEHEDLWWEVSPWKVHWDVKAGEGQIKLADEMRELLDPEDEEYYWRNRVRRSSVTTMDKVLYWFDQPNAKTKGTFKRFGTIESFREVPRHYSAPAGDLALSIESEEPLGDVSWIFAGSLFDKALNKETGKIETFYVADRIGVMMQLMRDDFSVLDNSIKLPRLENRIGTAFTINRQICPPMGTQVKLIFTPTENDPNQQFDDEDFEKKKNSRNNSGSKK